jgi:hypothetical protein
MGRLSHEQIEIARSDTAGKSGPEVRRILEDLAEKWDHSLGDLYRITAEARVSGRKIRRDAGRHRIAITDEQVEAFKEYKVRFGFTTPMALELCELNDRSFPKVSEQTANAWMRQAGLSHRRLNTDVRPAEPWEARGPNDIWQFDTTKLEQLHYDVKTKLLSWNPRANRKNSRGERSPEIWLYAVEDDHPRVKFAKAYPSLNQYNHLDFLKHACLPKPSPTEFPFFGIPRHIYMDNGGANQATKFLVALKKLGIHRIPTDPSYDKPFAARKRGKIENGFKGYAEWLKLFKIRPMTWAEAEESLYRYLLKVNRRVHSSTGVAPFARWMEIGRPQGMPCDEIYRLLSYDHWTRKVSRYLTITIDNHIYKLKDKKPFNDWLGEEIQVYMEPGKYEKVFVVLGTVEDEIPEVRQADIVRAAFNFPERTEQTSVDEARAKPPTLDGKTLKLWDTDTTAPAYLPRKPIEFDETRIAEKRVETATGWRPAFAPELWLNRGAAVDLLKEAGFFPVADEWDGTKDQLKEQKDWCLEWLNRLMAEKGRITKNKYDEDVAQISETVFKEALSELEQSRLTGTEGA